MKFSNTDAKFATFSVKLKNIITAKNKVTYGSLAHLPEQKD